MVEVEPEIEAAYFACISNTVVKGDEMP